MAILMNARGEVRTQFPDVVGRIADDGQGNPSDTILVCRGSIPTCDPSEFAAVLATADTKIPLSVVRTTKLTSLDHLSNGDIVLASGHSGMVRTLYRAASEHNALFVTEDCNNNCLMCSQPPKVDAKPLIALNERVVDLIRVAPPAHLGVTGGEPTLLGAGFINLLAKLKNDLPSTCLTVLSNGRAFADSKLCSSVAEVSHPALRFSIPVHADIPDVHDYIAQVRGAFWETISGLYNLETWGLESEVRIVLNAINIPRLSYLAEWIWRKIPFVRQVIFMGLENMGYVKKNFDKLWIDPINYSNDLNTAAQHLYRRGIDVSIYNLPYCVLPRDLWGFARQSISDHKQIELTACSSCDLTDYCAGFFASAQHHHSQGVHPMHREDIAR